MRLLNSKVGFGVCSYSCTILSFNLTKLQLQGQTIVQWRSYTRAYPGICPGIISLCPGVTKCLIDEATRYNTAFKRSLSSPSSQRARSSVRQTIAQ